MERKPFMDALQQWLEHQAVDYEEAEKLLQQVSDSTSAFYGDRLAQVLAAHPEKMEQFIIDHLYQLRQQGNQAAAAKIRERQRMERVNALLSPETPNYVIAAAILGFSAIASTIIWSMTNGQISQLQTELDRAHERIGLYDQRNREMADTIIRLERQLPANRGYRAASNPVSHLFGGQE
jgi:hypothetical protein